MCSLLFQLNSMSKQVYHVNVQYINQQFEIYIFAETVLISLFYQITCDNDIYTQQIKIRNTRKKLISF